MKRLVRAAGRRAILVGALAGVALAAGPASSWAATTYTVCSAGCDFTTIQAAVNAAAPGDTIDVSAGTYNENVVVNKSLTIRGAQAGNDARSRTGLPESIVNNFAGAFNLQANNVTIDGFTLQEQTGTDQGAAIVVTNQYSGYQILNNIVRNNHFGVYANSSGVNSALVQHNLFDANNAAGASSGNGIYADQGTKNVTVNANKFTNNDNSAVLIVGDGSSTESSGIDVTNNQVVDNGGLIFFQASGVTVTGNTINNDDTSSAIVAAGNVQGLLAQANTVKNGAYSAFRVCDCFGGGENDAIEFIGNTALKNGFGYRQTDVSTTGAVQVHFNRFRGNGVGADNELVGPSVTTNAENNWWGCNGGPGASACDPVNGNVDASPWLVLRVSANKQTIDRNGQATITGSLRKNSAGVIPAGNVFPDGTIIRFSASLGATLSQSDVPTTNAIAQTKLTPGSLTGNVVVTGRLDSATDTATVNVIP